MNTQGSPVDWGEASEKYDDLVDFIDNRDLSSINEAQTRYDVIDRMLREVFGWKHGNIAVEEHSAGDKCGYVDYILRVGDYNIVVEAKRIGAAFPNPTRRTRLKLSGSVLGTGEISLAISQAEEYARIKNADVVVVTNGLCWCIFSMKSRTEDDFATILFPNSDTHHAQQLFEILSEISVENGGLCLITNSAPRIEHRLISAIKDSDGRVDRNNIADYITPALNNALYADALLSNDEALEKCFVTTEARSKFDALLGMHLSDPKPSTVTPAPRIKTGKQHGMLEQVLARATPGFAPPVTLILGPVGAGKSTYLRHFERLSGRKILDKINAHWIYIDFEEMGKGGFPRAFIYRKLRDYLLANHPKNPTDYINLVEPAYRDEVSGLTRGPLAQIAKNKEELNSRIADYIQQDFNAVEPYVDKLFKYLGQEKVCVIVLDNVDLYEDEKLETSVFAEGLALSKRVHCQVIVSLREKTYVRHRTDSAFDAYELRKLWLDPPPFRSVLSSRLTFAKKILEGRSAQILLANGIHLNVPDLSQFFNIVQRSILQGQAGEYIESVSDLNIRRGLTLVTNFLTSGHIQADKAISNYIKGNTKYYFPFHEIFKGTMLAQWKHYKEDRSDCINLFDSRLGINKLRLLRLHLLRHLSFCAQNEDTLEVSVDDCIRLFSEMSASESHIIETLLFLQRNGLVRCVKAEEISINSFVVASKSGGYYSKILSHSFVYIESCMNDTAIDDIETWERLSEISYAIERESSIGRRMELRRDRMIEFISYLSKTETFAVNGMPTLRHLSIIDQIKKDSIREVDNSVLKANRIYRDWLTNKN